MSILEQRHQEMLKEIWHTHHHEFKVALRKNEQLLESLLGRLREVSMHQACK